MQRLNRKILVWVAESERDSMHPKYVCHNTTEQKQTGYIPSHRNGFGLCLVLGAPRTVDTAPPRPGAKEREAQALYRIFAQNFALFDVQEFSRRVLEVFFSGARVTLDVGADVLPYAWFLR